MKHEAADLGIGAVKAYPFAVAGASFLGLGLQDWVYITAIAVAVCQLAVFGWKFARWLRSFDVKDE
jgi:purine-cytosine permease-like protein